MYTLYMHVCACIYMYMYMYVNNVCKQVKRATLRTVLFLACWLSAECSTSTLAQMHLRMHVQIPSNTICHSPQATPEHLIDHLLVESVDDSFHKDFLLTYRTFLDSPQPILTKLKEAWHAAMPDLRDRVSSSEILYPPSPLHTLPPSLLLSPAPSPLPPSLLPSLLPSCPPSPLSPAFSSSLPPSLPPSLSPSLPPSSPPPSLPPSPPQITVILLNWVSSHFPDFEGREDMTQFLEWFEAMLKEDVRETIFIQPLVLVYLSLMILQSHFNHLDSYENILYTL